MFSLTKHSYPQDWLIVYIPQSAIRYKAHPADSHYQLKLQSHQFQHTQSLINLLNLTSIVTGTLGNTHDVIQTLNYTFKHNDDSVT